MSDPDAQAQNLALADISPRMLLKGAAPRLIDEWQLAPRLWDAIRFEVDHRDGFGHFLLTGSAVPVMTEEIRHTGTGRFAWLRMRPMSLWESGESNGESSLGGLFSDDAEDIFSQNPLDLSKITLGGDKLIEDGAGNLKALANLIDTTKMKAPSFLMVLTGTSPYAYRRKDGIYVVPIGCLRD